MFWGLVNAVVKHYSHPLWKEMVISGTKNYFFSWGSEQLEEMHTWNYVCGYE